MAAGEAVAAAVAVAADVAVLEVPVSVAAVMQEVRNNAHFSQGGKALAFPKLFGEVISPSIPQVVRKAISSMDRIFHRTPNHGIIHRALLGESPFRDNNFHNGYWGAGCFAGGAGATPSGFAYWGGYPFGWGGYWNDYFCPYGPVYADAYPIGDYGYSYPDNGQYAANFLNPPSATGRSQMARRTLNQGGKAPGNEGLQYYNESRGVCPEAIIRESACGWRATREWSRRKMPRSTS